MRYTDTWGWVIVAGCYAALLFSAVLLWLERRDSR